MDVYGLVVGAPGVICSDCVGLRYGVALPGLLPCDQAQYCMLSQLTMLTLGLFGVAVFLVADVPPLLAQPALVDVLQRVRVLQGQLGRADAGQGVLLGVQPGL